MPTSIRCTASLGLFSAVAIFFLLVPPPLPGQSQGTVSATGGSGLPGSAFNIPVTVSLDTGVTLDTLSFGVRIVPEGAAPALTGTLSFTKDASLPAPNIIDTGSGPNLIAVAWLLPPISPALTETRSLGFITMTIPASAQAGQTYTIQVAGALGQLGSTDVTLTPGPNATLTVAAPSGGGG